MPPWLASAIPARPPTNPVSASVPVGFPVLHEPGWDDDIDPNANNIPRRRPRSPVFPSSPSIRVPHPQNLPAVGPRPIWPPRGRSRSPIKIHANKRRRQSRSRSSSPSYFPAPSGQVSRPPLHPPHPSRQAETQPRPSAYASNTDIDTDAEWSTLPSRKKVKAETSAKPASEKLGIRVSGGFRMPGLIGGKNGGAGGKGGGGKNGVSGKKTRVVTYLPPPMAQDVETREVDERGRGDVDFTDTSQYQQQIPHSNVSDDQVHQFSLSSLHDRYSSPTVVNSSSPPDVHLSVKVDDIMNNYPSTRMLMSKVRISSLSGHVRSTFLI